MKFIAFGQWKITSRYFEFIYIVLILILTHYLPPTASISSKPLFYAVSSKTLVTRNDDGFALPCAVGITFFPSLIFDTSTDLAWL